MTLAGLRVLLAEDNPTNQLVATQMLESLGASVSLAEDGAEALEIIGRETFDVMLVDIEMPRVSGIDVIRNLRAAEGPVAAMPMIALTAYVMREHRAAIDAAGADGVIAKPILSIEQFGAEIRRYMRRRIDAAGGAALGAGPANGATNGATQPVIVDAVYETLSDTIGEAAMAELLDKVVIDTEAAQARLEQARESLSLSEVRAVTHILISVAGAIGAHLVQVEAKRLNEAAHAGDSATVAAGLPGLLGEIDRMVGAVRQRIDE